MFVIALVTGAVMYVMVRSNLAGLLVKHSLTDILAEQLDTRITVDDDVEVSWNNQLVLNHLTIYDRQGEKMLQARRVLVAFDLWPLLSHHLVLNTCQLIDFDIHAYRATADSAANYQFAIDALRIKKDPDKQPFVQQLDLNAILLRQGNLSYDVLDKPHMTDSPIDPNHVKITKLSANVHVHDKNLLIKKFHCNEHDNAYKAELITLALNMAEVLNSPAGEHRMLVKVQKLEMEGQQIQAHIDIDGDSDSIELMIHQLLLPHGHKLLSGMDNVRGVATVRFSQLRNPVDSLYIAADIHDLSAQTQEHGQVHIRGSYEGTPYLAEIHCNLNNESGKAELAARMQRSNSHQLKLTGHCAAKGINLSKLVPRSTKLGSTNVNLNFDIEHISNTPLKLALNGIVNQLEWRGHNYRNIRLNCKGDIQDLQGNIALADSLGDIDLNFGIDLSSKQHHYQLDGAIAHLNPNALHLTEVPQFDSIAFSSELHADVKGSGLPQLNADIKLHELEMAKGDSLLHLGTLDFVGSSQGGRLSSSIANLRYSQRPDNLSYQMQGRIAVANELLSMLGIDVIMSKDILFEARIDSAQMLEQIYLEMPEIKMNGSNSIAATMRMNDDDNGKLYPLLDFDLHNAKHALKGTMKGVMTTSPLDLIIEPTTFRYNDEDVALTEARVRRNNEGAYVVDEIRLTGGQQEVSLSGIMAKDGQKDFILKLDNFDLAQVFSNIEKGYVQFGGRASGKIGLSSDPSLMLRSDSLSIRNFSYIGTKLGNASINLNYGLEQQKMAVTCDIETMPQYNTHIDCDIDMSGHSFLDLRVHPQHLPLDFIDYWVGGILQQFQGNITGDVRLYGNLSELQLEGTPVVDGHFTHQILGSHFHLNDTVKLSHNLLKLDHVKVDDEHGHLMALNALVTHTNLHNFGYKVNIDMPDARQGFLVLDRPKAPGRLYWGQIYAKGRAHLEGGNGKHRINVDFGTTDKSWIYLSPRAQDISPDQASYGFLTFRDKKELELQRLMTPEGEADGHLQPEDSNSEQSDIEVRLMANATEQCEVTVQLDPQSDDLLVCRGNGPLTITYNPQRDITLTGEYAISQGTYTMNMKPDIINKKFQLQNTSTVSFNGVPSEAELDLNCIYNIPSVNLSDLGSSLAAMSSLSRSTVGVDLQMNVRGQMAAPQIKFDFEVTNVNKEVDDIVHNVIGTEEKVNQQVLFLLLFAHFFPIQDEQSSSQLRPGAELSSLASASISSQFNQLMNRMSDKFTLGTNFKTDRGDFTDMEMDVSVTTRLLNDRLLLYGNLGYRDPAYRIGSMGNSSSFIGDFDIEYVINDARTWRAKVYSHYNERDYSINNALTTQGVGIIMSYDFKSIWDLWQRRKLLQKLTTTPNSQPTDSIQATTTGK